MLDEAEMSSRLSRRVGGGTRRKGDCRTPSSHRDRRSRRPPRHAPCRRRALTRFTKAIPRRMVARSRPIVSTLKTRPTTAPASKPSRSMSRFPWHASAPDASCSAVPDPTRSSPFAPHPSRDSLRGNRTPDDASPRESPGRVDERGRLRTLFEHSQESRPRSTSHPKSPRRSPAPRPSTRESDRPESNRAESNRDTNRTGPNRTGESNRSENPTRNPLLPIARRSREGPRRPTPPRRGSQPSLPRGERTFDAKHPATHEGRGAFFATLRDASTREAPLPPLLRRRPYGLRTLLRPGTRLRSFRDVFRRRRQPPQVLPPTVFVGLFRPPCSDIADNRKYCGARRGRGRARRARRRSSPSGAPFELSSDDLYPGAITSSVDPFGVDAGGVADTKPRRSTTVIGRRAKPFAFRHVDRR